MSKEEKDIVVKNDTTDTTEEKDNSTSFFGRLKKQVKTLNFKNNDSKDNEKTASHIDESAIEKELREKEKEVKKQEQELKKRALELEKAKKQFEEQQRKIEEEKKKNELARAERERLEKERIAREKELERQRIEKEKAEKREQERLEKERIAREKELERQRIEKEKAEKREQERLEKERIAREKELERQRIEKEKAEQREKDRLEKERIAREKELERQRIEKEKAEQREKDRLEKERIEKEQEEKRKREFRRKEKEFKLSEDKKKLELLQKENEMREHENTLLSLQTSLISLEDKIEEKKLTISTLKNRNADKEKIMLEEKRLNVLNSQRQVVLKDITTEKKAIEKIQKNLDIEYKLDGLKKEIHSIKKEVVNEDETAFKVKYVDNKPKNIFMVSLLSIKTFISKSILRNKVENYDKIQKVAKNIKVRIATSIILALLLSICFLVTLKFISSAKEHYISFGETNNSAVDTTDELKKQKEAEEKEKILKAQEQANAVRIDSEAQDEEITAKLAGTFSSYSFDVDREVTVNKKIHAFKSASWSEPGEVIEAGTKLTVDKIISPAGYIMYRISSGNLQGQYITANEKFVSVDKKNDQLENFISRPVAIKFLTTQNIYSDESLSSIRTTYGNGAQLNINGIGISKNNRLVYHVTDGTFVPVNPVRVTEVNREAPKPKNNENDNKNTATTNSQNTQKRTTR